MPSFEYIEVSAGYNFRIKTKEEKDKFNDAMFGPSWSTMGPVLLDKNVNKCFFYMEVYQIYKHLNGENTSFSLGGDDDLKSVS